MEAASADIRDQCREFPVPVEAMGLDRGLARELGQGKAPVVVPGRYRVRCRRMPEAFATTASARVDRKMPCPSSIGNRPGDIRLHTLL